MTRIGNDEEPILEARHLSKEFSVARNALGKTTRTVRAVDNVSLALQKGRTLGLVGESGCGKSTLGRMLIGHLSPTKGEIFFRGMSLVRMSRRERKPIRRQMQIVFQDPYASLNPSMTAGRIVGEALRVHGLYNNESPKLIGRTLERVGLSRHAIDRFPSQFSGGQRQRLGIARSIILDPEVLILDEPVSALDVSVQAQIINLLKDLQEERELAYLFIAHDISIIKHISDDIAVMYLGSVVERGESEAILESPRHPYTNALLAAVPPSDPRNRDSKGLLRLEGEMPSPMDPPSGCRFRTRCWKAQSKCVEVVPALESSERELSLVACHFPLQREERENRGLAVRMQDTGDGQTERDTTGA